MSKLAKLALLSSFAVASASGLAHADTTTAKKPTAPAAKTPAKKPAPPAKKVVVTPEHKKALATLMAGFKFGMSKDDVLAQLGKSMDDKYADQLKATTDVAAQDRIRADRKAEPRASRRATSRSTAKRPAGTS